MMKISKCLVCAGLLMPTIALADASNYNFAELQYLDGKLNSRNYDGFGFNGSFELTEEVFVLGRFSEMKSSGIKLRGQQLGLGYVFGSNDTGSVYGALGYVSKSRTGRSSEDGFSIDLGARMNLNPSAELNVGATYANFGSGDDAVAVTAGMVYRFAENISGVLNYSHRSRDRVLGLGLRLSF
jgi:hypothetical protein